LACFAEDVLAFGRCFVFSCSGVFLVEVSWRMKFIFMSLVAHFSLDTDGEPVTRTFSAIVKITLSLLFVMYTFGCFVKGLLL